MPRDSVVLLLVVAYQKVIFVLSRAAQQQQNAGKKQRTYMDKETMLHYLRNPYGLDATERRKARLQAADELERLYILEKKLKNILSGLKELKDGFWG